MPRLFIFLLAVLILLPGCTGKTLGKKELKGALIVMCDNSGSLSEKGKTQYVRYLRNIIQAGRGRVYLSVGTFAQKAEWVYNLQPKSDRNIKKMIGDKVVRNQTSTGQGTFFAPAMAKVIDKIEELKRKHGSIPVAVMILTDGGATDPITGSIQDSDVYRQAKRLADSGVEYLLVAPVMNQHRDRVASRLKPLVDADLIGIYSEDDVEEGATKLKESLNLTKTAESGEETEE